MLILSIDKIPIKNTHIDNYTYILYSEVIGFDFYVPQNAYFGGLWKLNEGHRSQT